MNASRGSSRGSRARTQGAALLGALAVTLGAGEASAHFFLEEPENWREQGGLGDPQKTGPCGDEGTAAETGTVTAFRSGQTITIRFRETIFHPGHFRVALATNDRSELPPPPPVMDGRTDCGSVPIMDPPVFPVLADGVLPHTSPLSGDQTIEVTLPDDVTCDHCTLQIIQWMSEHSAPCFYYHCADISISSVTVDSGAPADDAASPGADASTPETDAASAAMDSGTPVRTDAGRTPPPTTSGCACATPADTRRSGLPVAVSLGVLALLARRRRRA